MTGYQRPGHQAWEWIERTKGALRVKMLGRKLSNHFMVENPRQYCASILVSAATNHLNFLGRNFFSHLFIALVETVPVSL